MLKTVILATSMLVAAPVFAQDKPVAKESMPTQAKTADNMETTPATDDAAPDAKAAPVAAAATPQANPAPATQAAQPSPAQATGPAVAEASKPGPSQEQVAQAVGRDFAKYDKDANGNLNAQEFGVWMSSLRKAAEPAFVPGSPEATAWAAQAFTSADIDKSASVNRQELTVFLTPKAS